MRPMAPGGRDEHVASHAAQGQWFQRASARSRRDAARRQVDDRLVVNADVSRDQNCSAVFAEAAELAAHLWD